MLDSERRLKRRINVTWLTIHEYTGAEISTTDDNFDVHTFLRDAISKVKGTPPPLERSEEELIVQMEVLTIEKKFEELRKLQLESDKCKENPFRTIKSRKGKSFGN